MNLKTIQLGLSHLNTCVDLDKKAFNGLWTKSQWKRELTNPKRICIGVIDIETKTLLGLCSAWLVIDELQITFIAIYPIHQRKGVGGFLISDLIKRSESIRSNKIHLEVKATNEPAKAFYKSMGFEIVGNRSNFYKDGSDALIFNKQIKNHKRNN
jgi:ribosomal-protein-alanine N-acetyltransferase